MNDTCPICGAPYHIGREPNGTTKKLSRLAHAQHANKQADGKQGRRDAQLVRHAERLSFEYP